MGKSNNTFVALLDLLEVKHTKSFSDKYFNEHPHKYNLYGLSKMLSGYGIRNAATQIEDKENDLFKIKCPFVAHMGGDFVVVDKSPTPTLPEREGDSPPSGELEGAIHFIRNGKKLSLPVSEFIKSWSGIILLAEPSLESGEPNFKEHRKKDLLILAQQAIIAIAGILILVIAYINNVCLSPLKLDSGSPTSPIFPISPTFPYSILGITSLLLVNLIGVYICYLLVLKQLRIHSRYADKICTLFSKRDCNNVLESEAAKLFGVFGWSEIGLGYFTANIIILLCLPHLIPYSVIVNILSLPFTVWSVWYQKVRARQWCPLCLIVLILLWLIFIINLTFGYITVPDYSFHSLLSIVNCQLLICLYALPIFTLTLLLPRLSEGNQVAQLRQEINSIKANEKVFETLLSQQPFYEASKSDSQILFGNPDAQLTLTILTNPFCNPCAKMHARIDKLIGRGESNSPIQQTNIRIQYIFSAFNESMEYANRYFIAIYLVRGRESAWQLYSDWFEKGKAMQEAFFHDLQLDMTNPAIEIEFQKHKSWKEQTQLRATPTILVNGYKLPDNYKIEDLQNFTDLKIEIT